MGPPALPSPPLRLPFPQSCPPVPLLISSPSYGCTKGTPPHTHTLPIWGPGGSLGVGDGGEGDGFLGPGVPRGQRSREVTKDQLWACSGRERKIRENMSMFRKCPSFLSVSKAAGVGAWPRVTQTARALTLRAGGGVHWTAS